MFPVAVGYTHFKQHTVQYRTDSFSIISYCHVTNTQTNGVSSAVVTMSREELCVLPTLGPHWH